MAIDGIENWINPEPLRYNRNPNLVEKHVHVHLKLNIHALFSLYWSLLVVSLWTLANEKKENDEWKKKPKQQNIIK